MCKSLHGPDLTRKQEIVDRLQAVLRRARRKAYLIPRQIFCNTGLSDMASLASYIGHVRDEIRVEKHFADGMRAPGRPAP